MIDQKLSEAAPRPFHEMIRQGESAAPTLTMPETGEYAPFNLLSVASAASVAAAAAAVLWAVITVVSGLQIGWMAVGVGFLVGITVRVAGASQHPMLGYLGAFFAFLGCVTGNLLAVSGMLADELGLGWTEVLGELDLETVNTMMLLNFHPVDLLFYGMALYFGYKLSLDSD